MASVKQFPTIKSVRSFVIDGVGTGEFLLLPPLPPSIGINDSTVLTITPGGDYHNVKGGHWCAIAIAQNPFPQRNH